MSPEQLAERSKRLDDRRKSVGLADGRRSAATPRKPRPAKPAKPLPTSKYRNRRTVVDGISFASAKEARRYGELLLLQKAGQIADLKLQPRIKLQAGGVHICDYVADFFYYARDSAPFNDFDYGPIYEDCKGFKTPIYRLKKKLVLALTGITITET